ncbi:serine hydrolase [Brevibacterium sp. 5221]|uniref:Serine hydrolase n=1 Tax=Brevibacterium rongguiense TaxID=2695267 RepID=A0A6N9H4U0_9MICO|nr:serine hydrolase domain-containing protein [Brevibacterium rongguiense]MYM18851.1 serine hydrolase [Brevibacterium rongguiense]
MSEQGSEQADTTSAQRAAEEVGAFLDEEFASRDVPRPAWGVFLGGRLLAGENADGIYRIASMTKSFTAAAVLGLRAGLIPSRDGAPALDLDAPLPRYILALRAPEADPGLARVTVRDALTMASGLPTDDPWADRQEALSRADFDALLARPASSGFAPGAGFAYSNYSYALLGRLVEELTGRGYREVVAEHVIAPAGLADTGFSTAEVDAGRIVPGYRFDASGAPVELPFSAPGAFSAIGGLFSTVKDIGAWMHGFGTALREHAGHDGWDRVRRDMQQAQRLVDVEGLAAVAGEERQLAVDSYGYGLHHRFDARFGQLNYHSGGYPGFGSHMRWHPASGAGIVVFANRTYGPATLLARQGLDRFLEAVLPARAGAGRPGPGRGDVRPVSALEPSAKARALPARVEALVLDWDDALADELFEDNVDLDQPRAERRAAWEAVLAATGERAADEGGAAQGASEGEPEAVWETAARASWRTAGPTGEREVSITLTPFDTLQQITVRAVPGR